MVDGPARPDDELEPMGEGEVETEEAGEEPRGESLADPAGSPETDEEPGPAPPPESGKGGRIWLELLVVAALACAVFIPGQGGFGLWDPWETHYGEVARNMYESGDWISPWWGAYWPEGKACKTNADCESEEVCQSIRAEFLPRQATCKPKNIGREGNYFFSKPVLIMWMMALGMATFGVNEWGVRMPFAFISLLALLAVFYMMRRLFGRREAFFAAMILATTPFFFFLERQAMTDGPFVGTMTVALCFFVLGVFSGDDADRRSPRAYWAFVVAYALIALPQSLMIFTDMRVSMPVGFGWRIKVGPLHGSIWAGLFVLFLWFSRKAKTRRQVYFYVFYLFAALSSMGKGMLGFLLPGAIVFLYLVVTWDWKLLARVQLFRGALIFVSVGIPWYAAMFARHFRGFYDRFFVHDHFKRLATGVHQTDTGAFDHFIIWLGYGTWPWGCFIPAALARKALFWRRRPLGTEGRVKLFLMLWFFFAFALFTAANTKFHHYIYPTIPPLVMIVALFLSELTREKYTGRDLAVLASLVLFLLVAWNLQDNSQHLKNLFTYKYDRAWPSEFDYRLVLTWFGAAAAVPLIWLLSSLSLFLGTAVGVITAGGMGFMARVSTANKVALTCSLLVLSLLPLLWRLVKRHSESGEMPERRFMGIAPYALGLVSVCFTVWALNWYMGDVAVHWSQGNLWESLYTNCTLIEPPPDTYSDKRICKEDVVTYKMNWRGETYYSGNVVIPLSDDKSFNHYYGRKGHRGFFAFVEKSRLQSQLLPKLKPSQRKGYKKIDTSNIKFMLIKVPPATEK